MGLWDRLRGREEKPKALRVAVVGVNEEAKRLFDAYAPSEGWEPASACVKHALELVARREVAALEICVPAVEAWSLALAGIRAGLFVSAPCPGNRAGLKELSNACAGNLGLLRIRMPPLYYPPYLELKRLIDTDTVGRPSMLKLAARYGKGYALPETIDPGAWIRAHEIGFLALANWLIGPAARASARFETSASGAPVSSVLTWRHERDHQYGYLQLDFCPDLHVRTFTDPVHRSIELTGIGGVIFATRGEGQLLREPPLIVRGKSTTTAFELLADDWREVYLAMAREASAAINKGQPIRATTALADEALKILELAGV